MTATILHSSPDFRLPRGTRLNGIYEIDEPIASGGMGDIYKGHAIQTGDLVAIKVMREELAQNTAALALFRKEASALHHLYHEAIVRYFVFTIEPELQRPYLAMEFVEGHSLAAILERGPLSFEVVWDLKQRLALALQSAHDLGIVHRDLSPDNILVPFGDMRRAKIIDFGIARSTRPDSTGTVIGSGFAGKYSYVSPEQLGMFGGDVTAKSDIYSLGLVLAEAIRGRAIDMGSSHFDGIERRRNVPDLRAVDGRLRPLLELMLQPDPAQRLSSMAEVARLPAGTRTGQTLREMEPLINGELSPTTTVNRRRKRLMQLAIAVVASIAIGGIGWGTYKLLPSRTPGPGPSLNVAATNTKPLGPTGREQGSIITAKSRPGAETASPRVNPTTPSLVAPTLNDRDRQLANFITQYDGGECFFVMPVALNLSKPKIDGYGASLAPFQEFDTAFTRANKLEADIGVRQIAQTQCPAITFLSRVHAGVGQAPRLHLSSTQLRGGDQLSGTLSNIGTRHLAFLLVSETGTVHNLSSLLRPDGEQRSFNIPLPRVGTPGNQPELLIAITSQKPLDSLTSGGTLDAGVVFARLLAETENIRDTINATAVYFTLER